MLTDRQTGYPSVDRPWLKYYSEEAINKPLPKMTMYEYAWENNKNDLSDIAFSYFGTKISYGEFFENVQRAAKSFVAMDIKEGDMVTIMSMQTPETIYAIYGLNYIGAVANLVYMTLSEQEIIDTISETNSKVLMVLDAAGGKIEAVKKRINVPMVVFSVADSMPLFLKVAYRLKNKPIAGLLNWSEFLDKGKTVSLPNASKEHERMSLIVYTSGSTGNPKGVMLSNDSLNAHAQQDIDGIYGFQRGLSFLFILPPFLAYGISHLHTILCSGIEVILQIQIEPENVAKSIYKYYPECFVGTPAYIDAVMAPKYKKKDLSNLKFFVGGGGEVPEQKELAFNDYLREHHSKAKYSCGYGMTEAGATLCANCNDISKVGSVGIPFVKTNVKVIDRTTNEELPFDREGELYFSSPNTMLGYYHNEEATNSVLFYDSDGKPWIKSGDLGYVDEDGFVYVTGRIKRICFTRAKDGFSYKLFPQRIEELIASDERIELCGVITKEDEERINIPIVFVSLRDKCSSETDKELIRKELIELSAKELPEHEQPENVVILDTMPLTMSGKIDYMALEKGFLG